MIVIEARTVIRGFGKLFLLTAFLSLLGAWGWSIHLLWLGEPLGDWTGALMAGTLAVIGGSYAALWALWDRNPSIRIGRRPDAIPRAEVRK